jgi:pimeloyl-ACP methyl ester carboxylesterase
MIAIDQTGSGDPLVLLHGVGANRGVWAKVTPRLAVDRLVLAPDLPGFGDSEPVGPGFALGEVARALADALAERIDRPFDLLGNSLGGAVAVRLAFERPELVRRLILAAPAGFSPAPWPVAFAAGQVVGPAVTLRRIAGGPLLRSPTARRVLLWGNVAQPHQFPVADARAMVRASAHSSRVGAAVSAVLQVDLRSMLGAIHAPLGLIWGRHDRVVPISTAESIRAVRPTAVLVTISDAGHVPQLERPSQFASAVSQILSRLETETS